MKKIFTILAILALVTTLSPAAFATNGDNLIGVGPTSRAMGGVGIAAPQDAISAVFANPAAMCFGPYCPTSQFDFAATLFAPKPSAEVTIGGQSFKEDSEDNVYPIPAIGFSVPVGGVDSKWRFGLSAYGVSGLGVDYRNSDLDNPNAFGAGAPLIQGEYSQLQIMKFAPAFAYQATPRLSLGLAVHVNYADLDLRNGSSPGWSFGVQPGIIWRPLDNLSLGLTYVSPQEVDHERVLQPSPQDPTFTSPDLKLESPQQVGLGVAYEFVEFGLLLEANGKWINWSDANGYDDFDWNDQYVIALGAQWEVIPKLFLRLGYNYAENPVDDHDGWDGSFGALGPNDTVTVQGTVFPRYYYESFRIVGFPAIVEHHLTLGIGYEFNEAFSFNLGYMHAFKNDIKETGTAPSGQQAELKSELYENALDFGFTWRF
jgi:long-chain fatty acid transport protein